MNSNRNMTRFLKLIIVVIAMMASGTGAFAQSSAADQRLSREELAVQQADYIARELALDATNTKKYVDTYCKYQRELWKLGPRKGLTTDQRLARSQQILDLRKRYNGIYRSFLSEEQLDKAYKLEKRLIDRMNKNKRKKGNRRR